MKKTIVLAYSGGLDTSAIIPWIKDNYNFDVVAFVADIGQSKKDLYKIKEKAIISGASDCYISDLKDIFVKKYVFPMLKTGAIYEGEYLLGTAIARPLIAKAQVDYAKKINAIGLCHGSTGKGNDQVRFELAYSALAPSLLVIAPWREWKFQSREDLLKYLKTKNIVTNVNKKKIYSRDENIFHVSTEGGILEDPWNPANEDCWFWTKSPLNAPNKPKKISLKIEKGCVVSINNKFFNEFNCLKRLNKIGAKHSIGRIDIVENRLIGMKSRGCYETPGGTIIYKALRSLEQLVFDRECMYWKNKIALQLSSIIYDGKWFTPIRKSLQKSSDILSSSISGKVVVELYKGSVRILQKKSLNSLYSKKYVTFGKDNVYNQIDAKGFIRLFSLSSRIRALKNKK
ncbi:argininosuccinate synthase [Buchnera aphidicola]|uniref:Argininosuccinate synthase n=1 Tax=Buchnera aphidicola subsp. Cinara cedri (strain Cc) TaxID=372461 RepID=ASSY_BUCCC|nr:argininosuccinate synthase [Buchnera aphidicola]Q058D6.1 RecName: Full=Argininosuccinate synthase; AltName: Full=Citrulline--aspartate ligase [Buchnera aphidicola BCc]ABJ90513.1 argininosuccinate synthase [Buchnera aphidicola BCc]